MVSRSTDLGSTFQDVFTDGGLVSDQSGRGAIVPGQYALMSRIEGSPNQVAVAAPPYDTWSTFEGPFGPRGTSTSLIAHLVSEVDGAAALMMLSPAGLLVTADATTPPAALADFTEVDLSSIVSDTRGMATNGVFNVIAGSSPSGDNTTLLRAPVSAGGSVGDWDSIILPGVAGHTMDVVWTGSRFVAVTEAGLIYTSEDALTWGHVGDMLFTGVGDFRMLADTDSGLVVAYRGSSTPLYVGRGDVDVLVPLDVHTDANVIRAGDDTFGRLAWDPVARRLFGFSSNTTDQLARTI